MKIRESIDDQGLRDLGYTGSQIRTILQSKDVDDFIKYINPTMSWQEISALILYYNKGVDFSIFKNKNFTAEQMEELCMQAWSLKKSKISPDEIKLWADPKFSLSQLRSLFLARALDEDIAKYIDSGLSEDKLQDRLDVVDVMYAAKKDKLDISVFRDWDLTPEQARTIYYYMQAHPQIDISWFADSAFTVSQMHRIARALIDGIDVSWLADPMFSEVQMRSLINNLKEGIDVSWFAFPKVDHETMRLIEEAITGGIPEDVVKRVAKECKFDFDKMWDRPELKSVTRLI